MLECQWTPGSCFPLIPQRGGTASYNVILLYFISCTMNNIDKGICKFLNITAPTCRSAEFPFCFKELQTGQQFYTLQS